MTFSSSSRPSSPASRRAAGTGGQAGVAFAVRGERGSQLTEEADLEVMARKPSALQGAAIVGGRYLGSTRQGNPEGRMPLMDHLRELRNRIVKVAIVIVIGMIVALVFSNQSWNFLTRPFCEASIAGKTGCHQVGDQLTYSTIFDPLFTRVEIAFYLALVGTSPVWLYQLWAFIAPGLYSREKKWAYLFTGTAVPLFVGGAVLAYFVMDRGLHYLLGLAYGNTLVLPSIDTYISYLVGMVVGFGLAFELPLVLVMLNVAGILTHERFRKWRKTLIFVTFIVSGMVNPSPDPTTMLLLGGVCVILVEMAEVFVFFNDKRRARLHPGMYANLSDDEVSSIDEPASVD
jgi:sec-independent protein translocase protein TatC